MRKNFTLWASAIMAVALCAGVDIARAGSNKGTQSVIGSNASADDLRISLEEVDVSNDGKVSPEEARTYLQKLETDYNRDLQKQKDLERQAVEAKLMQENNFSFAPADTDRDGIVSPEERLAYLEKHAGQIVLPFQAPPEKEEQDKKDKKDEKKVSAYTQEKYDRRLEEMKSFDANKDGVLQAGELQKSADQKFSAADINRDGILTSSETETFLEHFRSDKSESYGEARAKQQAGRIENRYKNADENEDGKVSKQEYEDYMSKHQANFDRDGDGIISEKEYRMDGEKVPSSYARKPKED